MKQITRKTTEYIDRVFDLRKAFGLKRGDVATFDRKYTPGETTITCTVSIREDEIFKIPKGEEYLDVEIDGPNITFMTAKEL